MTGVMRPTARGRYKVWVLADNAAKPALAAQSLFPPQERKPGQWFGAFYTADPDFTYHPCVGVRWWVTDGIKLLATNHPHWVPRIGADFNESCLP